MIIFNMAYFLRDVHLKIESSLYFKAQYALTNKYKIYRQMLTQTKIQEDKYPNII